MASEDQNAADKPDRKSLLEEIQRRAEEAELRRLEDEEGKGRTVPPAPPPSPADYTPFPLPVPGGAPVSAGRVIKEEQLIVLRERLGIALERGKLEKAATLLAELRTFTPSDPVLGVFERRLSDLREQAVRLPETPPPVMPGTVEPPAALPTVASSAVQPPGVPREGEAPGRKPTPPRKAAAELLEEASSLYQQEKYAQALRAVDDALEQEGGNEGAIRLREQIVKAQEIIDLIKKEEARRRAEEASQFPEELRPRVPVAPVDDKDPWGTGRPAPPDTGFDLPPEEAGPVAPPKPPVAERLLENFSKIRIPWKAILGVLIAVAAAIVGYVAVDTIKSAISPPRATILVLPPASSMADSTLAVVASGLTEDIIDDFAMVPEVRVISARSAFSLIGSSASHVAMARRLMANYYLQWNILRMQEWIVVQASLFDTAAASPVVTTRHQSAFGDLCTTRRDMVRKVLAAIEIDPGGEGGLQLRRTPTQSAEAYEAYLWGRSALREVSPEGTASALAHFERAVSADSGFTEAQSALGWSSVLMYEQDPDPPGSLLNQALSCVQRSVEVGLVSSETFRVWGMVEVFRAQHAKSLERFEDAIRVAPSDAEAQRRLAVACLVAREYDGAVKATQAAMVVDPVNVETQTVAGMVYQFLGQYVYAGAGQGGESRERMATALQAYQRGIQLSRDPSEYGSGLPAELLVYLQQHDRAVDILTDRLARVRDSYSDLYRLARIEQSAGLAKTEWQTTLLRAKTTLREYLSEVPEDALALSYLALVHTRLGEFKEALAAIKQAQTLAPRNLDVLYNTARMYTLQRNKAKALETLAMAVQRRFSLPQLLDMDFYNLRSEESFLDTVLQP